MARFRLEQILKLYRMKKNILLAAAIVLSIAFMAFNSIDTNNTNEDRASNATCKTDELVNELPPIRHTEFFYDIRPRFTPIKKSQIDNAHTIFDLIDPEYADREALYDYTDIIVIEHDKRTNIHEPGDDIHLNYKQLQLLQSAPLSSHFLIHAEYQTKNTETDSWRNDFTTPHFTVVPEQQTKSEVSKEGLLLYLEMNNKTNTINLDEDKLMPARIYFTITEEGIISNIMLEQSCGYPEIDETMINLISNLPGTWEPAKDVNGKNVAQELLVSYGMMGC